MKKIACIVIFLILLPNISYGDWFYLYKGKSQQGEWTTYYIDVERIKEFNGYVYYWAMQDSLKRNEDGDMSISTYNKGDCNRSRVKVLSYYSYFGNMGKGGMSSNFNPPEEWLYPPPKSSIGVTLEAICKIIK